MTQKPNIILIVVDQMRFDALGINGNPIISTPTLNMMAAKGYNFLQAYTAVPSCIPARAALMTGLSQAHHGRVGYEDGVSWQYDTTLGSVFTRLGYQTQVVGKMHVYPERHRLGFEHVELHDGYLHAARNMDCSTRTQYGQADDYLTWLKEQKGATVDIYDNGLDCNSWVARPWMYEESLHPTNWTVTKSIDFLRRQDPTVPFFLKMSFARPHSPLDPPSYYFDMYQQVVDELPEIEIGDWAKEVGADEPYSITALKGQYSQHELNRMRAGYYGAITHIDHQIGRFLIALEEYQQLNQTIIVFLSDHGDQLGEHHLFRKAYPYQGSIHIPFIVYDPGNCLGGHIRSLEQLIELRDVLPTLVDFATNGDVPDVDGMSVKPALSQADFHTRDYLHGEHSLGVDSSQYIVTPEWKYIWFSVRGVEQLFHLSEDPNELHNVLVQYPEVAATLKGYLIQELQNREEGFVHAGQLVPVSKTKVTLNHLRQSVGDAE